MTMQGLIEACRATIDKLNDAQGQVRVAREAIGSAAEHAMMALSMDSVNSETATAVQARLSDQGSGAQNSMDEGSRAIEGAKEVLEGFIARLMG
jgi:hypothetical protein